MKLYPPLNVLTSLIRAESAGNAPSRGPAARASEGEPNTPCGQSVGTRKGPPDSMAAANSSLHRTTGNADFCSPVGNGGDRGQAECGGGASPANAGRIPPPDPEVKAAAGETRAVDGRRHPRPGSYGRLSATSAPGIGTTIR